MCGIFGQFTNNYKRINDGHIKILGMANVVRGDDSCGITYDGEIYYGLNRESNFKEFIKSRKFKALKYPVIFGHTRKSSVGTINEANAHPFGFDENKDREYRYLGAHNGTLYNHTELAKEYGIETSEEYRNDYNILTERIKIDSEVLLEILTKNTPNQDFSILEKYNGGAALVWTDTEEPNTAYLFCGQSKEYSYSAKQEIERPIFVYIESTTNMYFSSLKEPLLQIGGTEENVFHIEPNVVFKIKNGNFNKAEQFKINRDEITSKRSYTRHYPANNYNGYDPDYDEYYGHRNTNTNLNTLGNIFEEQNKTSKYNLNNDDTATNARIKYYNLLNKQPYLKELAHYEGRIYENHLRYYKNGNRVSGICIYIPFYGFYKLKANTKNLALQESGMALSRTFNHNKGCFEDNWGNQELTMRPNSNHLSIPFPGTAMPTLYYMYDGILLKSVEDYDAIKLTPILFNLPGKTSADPIKLSHASVLPVIDVTQLLANARNIIAYKDGKPYKGMASGKAFPQDYVFNENGQCTSIITNINQDFFTGLKVKSTNGLSIIKENESESVEIIQKADDSKADNFGIASLLNHTVTDNELGDSRARFYQEASKIVDVYKSIAEENDKLKKNDAKNEYEEEIEKQILEVFVDVSEQLTILREALSDYDKDPKVKEFLEVINKIEFVIAEKFAE